MFGTPVREMQGSVSINNGTGKISGGPLAFIEGGLAESGPLAGDGYFLALKWTDVSENATSLKVGLVPSASGMDLVECIDDLDRNGVFKITDKNTQKFVVEQSNADHTVRQEYSLKGLSLQASE